MTVQLLEYEGHTFEEVAPRLVDEASTTGHIVVTTINGVLLSARPGDNLRSLHRVYIAHLRDRKTEHLENDRRYEERRHQFSQHDPERRHSDRRHESNPELISP